MLFMACCLYAETPSFPAYAPMSAGPAQHTECMAAAGVIVAAAVDSLSLSVLFSFM